MRKRFNELTREEMLALTDTDRQFYLNYAMAEQGLINPVHPGSAPEAPDFPEPTETVYEIRGLIVTSKEEADIILNLKTVHVTNYKSDYNRKYIEPVKHDAYNASITKSTYYKKSVIDKYDDEMKLAIKLKSQHDEDMKIFNKAEAEIKEQVAFIDEMINSVKRESNYLIAAKQRYEELSELAEGNTTIAKNFFEKAYPIKRTEEILADFYIEDSTYAIKALSYEEFCENVGIEICENVGIEK